MLRSCRPSPTDSSPTSCGSSSSPCCHHAHPTLTAGGPPPPHRGGRPRQISDRACFAAVVFMGRTSIPWELLPARELGCGSYSTAYRRFSAWTRAGVFDRLSLLLLDQLGEAGRIDWRRVSVDSVSLRAVKRGSTPAHTRPTVARPAASSTWPPMAAGSRSQSS